MNTAFRATLCMLLLSAAAGCGTSRGEGSQYTLYRNSVLDSLARYHVASFDADEKAAYNQENCDLARQLFQAQPGVTTKFWCEKGKFRP